MPKQVNKTQGNEPAVAHSEQDNKETFEKHSSEGSSELSELKRVQTAVKETYTNMANSRLVKVVYDQATKVYEVYFVYQDKLVKWTGMEKQYRSFVSMLVCARNFVYDVEESQRSKMTAWLKQRYVQEMANSACYYVNNSVDKLALYSELASKNVIIPTKNYIARVSEQGCSFLVSTKKYTSARMELFQNALVEKIDELSKKLGLQEEDGVVKINVTSKDYVEISFKKSLFAFNSETYEEVKKIIDELVENLRKQANSTYDKSAEKLTVLKQFVLEQYKHFLCMKEEPDTDVESEH